MANWKRQVSENVSRVFETDADHDHDGTERDDRLKKIGELTVERAFLARGLVVDPSGGI